ncbi:DUF1559 family PulG-like putative transporter [Rubinisphaera italica]|uniref:DUF1559 domain-containing protein n=1 Tax=Rubinisphaera italica TaxID=2527969 RepID=A0A5C5X9A1_9PLAN|nr:DUF1559 domain-containing protein [Rubinisphaera italica]TWT59424.1 hypothetical protein Pan54_01300 [Rubinisphaera italica]
MNSNFSKKAEGFDSEKCRAGLKVVEVGIAVLIVGVLIALMLPGTRRAGPAARRSQCVNNLRNIGIALYNYADTYGTLPPAYTVDAQGHRLHSWRTLLLPFLNNVALYRQIDLNQPWDSPANLKAFNTTPDIYRCPESSSPATHTSYLAIVTTDSCIQATEGRELNTISNGDGLAQTLLIVEMPEEDAVHWMAPQDASEASFLKISNDSRLPHQSGMNVLFADGRVTFLSAEISQDILRALITATSEDNEILYHEGF